MNISDLANRTSNFLSHRLAQTRSRAEEIRKELGPHTPDQVLLKVDADLSPEQIQDLAEDYGATVSQQLRIPDSMKEQFDGQLLVLKTGPNITEAQTLAALEGDQRVLLAAANDEMEMLDGKVPSSAQAQSGTDAQPSTGLEPDDLHPEQWALKNQNVPGGKAGADIHAPQAWEITTGKGKNGPIVAIVDSGIDAFHEDLKDNLWTNPHEIKDGLDNDNDGFIDDINGLNAIDESGNIFDEVGHGSHVAGIIGATGNNSTGITGVNWDSQLLSVKIADGARVSLLAAISGTLYAAERGARIANHSWGGPRRNPILENIMDTSPMLHVCAAGNRQSDSDQVPFYPAGYDSPNVISVGASTRQDTPLFFSNWGANTVDLHAPGARVYSTLPRQSYDELSGTSMAAPHVSGVAALIASKYPNITNEQLKDRLIFSSDPIEEMKTLSVSGGRLNAHRALEDDSVAPAEITNFKLLKTSADGFSVSWTGVGDDLNEGRVSRYQLEADYGDHKERLIPEFPSEPGSKEVYTFKTPVVDSERPFRLNLNAVDNVGNRNSTVSLVGTIPSASVPLASNFDQDDSWMADGKWAKVEDPKRGLVYADSPDGPHDPDSDTSLTSPVFSLTNLRNGRLTFDAKMKTNKYDFIFVQVSTNGKSWSNLAVLREDKTPGYDQWGEYSYDLSEYDGAERLQVRFNYEPSNSSKEDGVYIDNVKVMAAEDK